MRGLAPASTGGFHRLPKIDRASYGFAVATQGERRADTRRRLLLAAAELFAERGVDGTSIDAIAERADRTSGAVYDHFGGKDGVLFALLDTWVEELGAVIGAELTTATTLDERLGVLWRNVSAPVVGGDRWITLELELWTHAARNPVAREHLVRRYRGAWRGIVELAGQSADDSTGPRPSGPPERGAGPSGPSERSAGPSGPSERRAGPSDRSERGLGPAVIGVLLGLEMMRRVDPSTVDDDLALGALRGVVAGTRRAADDTTPAGDQLTGASTA